MNKEEKEILERIEKGIKEIKDTLSQMGRAPPMERALDNEKPTDPNLPSEKQINFMKKNNLEIKEGLTRKEASAIIDEFIKAHPRPNRFPRRNKSYPDY